VRVLVVNAGSTSLKLHLVDGQTSEPVGSLAEVRGGEVEAVAHRVVHGAARFRDPVLVDAEVLAAIEELEPLAPLHNRPALAGIDAAMRALPELPHVAVFDTAFHATIPEHVATYAVPRPWREEWGIRRFGFHGLSVEWNVRRAGELLGGDRRLVVCHLGGGCSITAVVDGRSVDTTMGFSPLEGVPMVTRSGSVDPGALLYLLRERHMSVDELDRALNEDSGLHGLSGRASMRDITEAVETGDPDACLALDVFVHRLAGAVAAMAAAAEGLDALVFTAGIGENSGLVRERTCARLPFLDVELDHARNTAAEPDCDVALASSRVRVLVCRTREELVAARAARAALANPK
jgi:acetate kinase